jgi:hypothetical protein
LAAIVLLVSFFYFKFAEKEAKKLVHFAEDSTLPQTSAKPTLAMGVWGLIPKENNV